MKKARGARRMPIHGVGTLTFSAKSLTARDPREEGQRKWACRRSFFGQGSIVLVVGTVLGVKRL